MEQLSSAARLRLFMFAVDQSHQATLLVEAGRDEAGSRVLFANMAAARLLGDDAERLSGAAFAELASTPAGAIVGLLDAALASRPQERLTLRDERAALEAVLERAPTDNSAPPCWLVTLRPLVEHRPPVFTPGDACFRAAWEAATDAMVLFGPDGRILLANPAFYQLYDLAPEQVIGQTFELILPPEMRQAARERFDAAFHGEGDFAPGEIVLRRADGAERWLEAKTSPLLRGGVPVALLSIIRDITAQHQAAEMLRQVGHMARIGGWEYDVASGAISWTDELYAIHDLPPGQVPNLEGVLSFYPEDVRPWITAAFEDALHYGTSYDLTLPFVSTSGRRKWVRTMCQVDLHEGRPTRLRGTFQDITVYKEAEEALSAQAQALSMLGERERLARELHDSLGQMLAYISIQSQAARDLILQGRLSVGMSSLEAVAQVAQEAQADVRAFIRGTKAGLGSRGGVGDDLVTAIRRLLDSLREGHQIEVELTAPADRKIGPLSPVSRLHLLRIVEEALVNVRRHAAARRVKVTVEYDGDGLRVEVSDDGQGFDLMRASRGSGYGLEAMRSRAADAGGWLQISSGAAGTRLVVWVPLVRGQASAA